MGSSRVGSIRGGSGVHRVEQALLAQISGSFYQSMYDHLCAQAECPGALRNLRLSQRTSCVVILPSLLTFAFVAESLRISRNVSSLDANGSK